MSESISKTMRKIYQIRALQDRFLYDFLNDGALSPLLKLVKMDHTLDMELRGDDIVIYYRGGLLYKIKAMVTMKSRTPKNIFKT